MEANRKEEFTKDMYWLGARAVVAGEATLDQVVDAFARDFGRERDETRMKVQKRIEDLRARQPAPVSVPAGDEPAESSAEPAVPTGSEAFPALFDGIIVEVPDGGDDSTPPLMIERRVRMASDEGSPVPVRALALLDVVLSAQIRSGLPVREWNAMSQEGRDAAIRDELEILRECATARTAAENRINEVGLVAPDTTAADGGGTAMATGAIDGVLAGKIGAEGLAAGFDVQSDLANANVAASPQAESDAASAGDDGGENQAAVAQADAPDAGPKP